MIKLTVDSLRQIFPNAPKEVIDAFAAKQDVLTKAGINATRNRLAFFFANIEHESGGFTIRNLTENVFYTAARMAEVWPKRFKNAADVQARYGTASGWQRKAFDDIYGNRMGNRPGTDDGSRYIGRGGPQWTGRDGYAALERLTGLPAVSNPSIATQLTIQPEICAAFWTWKGLNKFADANDFIGCVKAWNGGTNGMADRQNLMAGNDPILKRLETVAAVSAVVPDKKPSTAKDKVVTGVVVAAGVGAGGSIKAAADNGVSAMEILMWIAGLSAVAVAALIIGFRIVKGHWPWTSILTGNQSQELSPPSHQPSDASLALASVQLDLPSAESPVTPSPQPSTPT